METIRIKHQRNNMSWTYFRAIHVLKISFMPFNDNSCLCRCYFQICIQNSESASITRHCFAYFKYCVKKCSISFHFFCSLRNCTTIACNYRYNFLQVRHYSKLSLIWFTYLRYSKILSNFSFTNLLKISFWQQKKNVCEKKFTFIIPHMIDHEWSAMFSSVCEFTALPFLLFRSMLLFSVELTFLPATSNSWTLRASTMQWRVVDDQCGKSWKVQRLCSYEPKAHCNADILGVITCRFYLIIAVE